jgi:hypothetical protein
MAIRLRRRATRSVLNFRRRQFERDNQFKRRSKTGHLTKETMSIGEVQVSRVLQFINSSQATAAGGGGRDDEVRLPDVIMCMCVFKMCAAVV